MSRRRTLNAAARRAAARAEAERLQRAQRRNRVLLILGAAVLVVAIVVAGVIIWRGSQATYLDDIERTPQGSDTSGGIPVGADGVAGTAGTAPRLDVYLDVQSAASVAFWQTQGEALQLLNAEGTIALWIHPVAFVDGGTNGFSTRAAQAAVVVADRAPQQFVTFFDAAMDMRAEGVEQLNDPDLDALALRTDVPQEVADQFTDNLFNAWVVAASDQAVRDGVEDTPVLLLDGEELVADWSVDGALAEAVADAG